MLAPRNNCIFSPCSVDRVCSNVPVEDFASKDRQEMRYLSGMVVLYVLAGGLIIGLPHAGECTSEQRARVPGECGIGVFFREALLWPLRLP